MLPKKVSVPLLYTHSLHKDLTLGPPTHVSNLKRLLAANPTCGVSSCVAAYGALQSSFSAENLASVFYRTHTKVVRYKKYPQLSVTDSTELLAFENCVPSKDLKLGGDQGCTKFGFEAVFFAGYGKIASELTKNLFQTVQDLKSLTPHG